MSHYPQKPCTYDPCSSSKQLTIAEFDWPFETALDINNRWVKLSQCIPWDELAESYYRGFRSKEDVH